MFKTAITFSLQSFTVPEFVCEAPPLPTAPTATRPGTYVPAPRSFALSEIPADKLAAMCDAFRKEIFKRANLTDPEYTPLVAPPVQPGHVPPVAIRASELIMLVLSEQHIKGLTTVLNEAADQGLIDDDDLHTHGDNIIVGLTPSIKISFHK